MKHIHVEMIGGLAGDMFLAAALDAQLVTHDALVTELQKIGLGKVQVHLAKVVRYGIRGAHVTFSGWDPEHDKDHRHLDQIEHIIQMSALNDKVKARTLELFQDLGRAEAEIHDVPLEHVHFHEVGAVDSILDFVGAAYVLSMVDATWSFGLIPQGHGMIETSHGPVPALAPATARLLQGKAFEMRAVQGELVTPTGAAILNALGDASMPESAMLLGDGYGAGTKEFDGLANVVRLSVYNTEKAHVADFLRDEVVRLVTEVDDATGEEIAGMEYALFCAGALDVVRMPVLMKKGRVGTQVAVLAHVADEQSLVQVLLTETTTFGVRRERLERWKLRREHSMVETRYGKVMIKVGFKGKEAIKAAPEYEDCARLAKMHKVPLRRVFEEARAAIIDAKLWS